VEFTEVPLSNKAQCGTLDLMVFQYLKGYRASIMTEHCSRAQCVGDLSCMPSTAWSAPQAAARKKKHLLCRCLVDTTGSKITTGTAVETKSLQATLFCMVQ